MRATTRACFVILAVAALGHFGSARAQEATDVPRRIRESVTLETSNAVAKKFGTVQDYLAAKQWSQAVDLLADVSAQHGDLLVPVAPGQYVNVARQCQHILAGSPREALAVYRRQVDPQARQWFEQGKAGDDAALERIVRQSFASSYGDDALTLLAERAWDRGDVAHARRLWEQLIPSEGETARGSGLHYPDASTPRAELAARLVLCSLLSGESERARRELEAFETQFGKSEGTLAGRTGELAKILTDVETESKNWTYPKPDDDATTFAFTPERTRVLPTASEIGAVQWSASLPSYDVTLPPRLALHDRRALCYYPLVYQDLVLLNDAERIYAWRLFSPYAKESRAAPAWPDGESESAVIFPATPDRSFAIRAPNVGTPRFTMSISQGRLYAKMGSPVTGRSKNETREVASQIVCLDLAHSQGRVVWNRHAKDVFEGDGWTFDGSPLVDGERLYVVARRSQPQMQLNVACFDAVAGTMLWNRKACTVVAPLAENSNLISHLLLTRGDDALYLSTDLGVVMAIDPRDGAALWASTYESRDTENDAVPGGHSQRGLQPCVYARGTVLAAPADHGGVMALEAGSGATRWERRLKGGVRHILGVTGEGAVIVSGDRLWALDLATGQVRWQLGNDEPAETGYGRGLLAGDLIYWPKHQEILMVRQRDGTLFSRRNLEANHGAPFDKGGNLSMTEGFLLVAQPDRLVAYGDYGMQKKRIEKDLSTAPNEAAPWFRLAAMNEADGEFDQATSHYRNAVSLARNAPPSRHRRPADDARRRLHRLLLRRGRAEDKAGLGKRALPLLKEAVDLSHDPQEKASALREVARTAERHGEIREAAEAWLDILRRTELAGHRSVDVSSDACGRTRIPIEGYARQELSRLFEAHRTSLATAFDLSLGEDLRNARSPRGAAAMEAAFRNNPLAENAPTALLETADVLKQDGDFARAALLLHEFAPQRTFRSIRPEIDRRLASLHESLQFPPVEGRTDASRPPLWKPHWAQNSGGGVTYVVPANAPPQHACVLRQEDGLTCIGLHDGVPRWTRTQGRSVRWAEFAGIHLLVGSDSQLDALDPETGIPRWTLPLGGGGSSKAPDATDSVDATPKSQFFATGDEVYILDGGARIVSADVWTGRLKWEFLPSERLRPLWLATPHQIAVQGESTGRLFQLDPATGKAVDRSHPAEREPWRTPPTAVEPEGLAVALRQHRLIGFPPHKPSTDPQALLPWKYDGPISWTNVLPALASQDEFLLALIDGDTLCRLNAESGRRIWSRAAARRPIVEPCRSLVLTSKSVFVAADGFVRSFRLRDGELLWETFLGSPERQAALVATGDRLIRFPALSEPGELYSLTQLDPATGRIEQSFHAMLGSKERTPVVPTVAGGKLVVCCGSTVSVYASRSGSDATKRELRSVRRD